MKEKHQILIVDDAEINRSMLADMLMEEYFILEASNGVEAVAILERKHSEIALVLLDIMMPEMGGFEVLDIMNRNEWLGNVPVIVISAETSSLYIDQAYDLGATDYLSRPFDEKTVRRRVKNTIMLYAKQKMLEGVVAEQIIEKEHNNFMMVEILSNIVEFRNGESGLHVLHIRTITELLLRQLMKITDRYPLNGSQIALIVNASALHDIGKISIPGEILNKPGRLTKEEFEVMKTHSAIGAQILENNPRCKEEAMVQFARDICRWHHERYDGRGYPDGLQGEEIPIAAQVVSMADVYDALTSERVYKPAYSHEKAMDMILNGECGIFNPLLLKCIVEIGPRIAEELEKSAGEQISSAEIADISRQLLSNGKVSNRTIALLEQERVKYQFFASMSKEIQFEYNMGTDLLTISEWGAHRLGIGEIISHPGSNAELQKVISFDDVYDLYGKLRKADRDNPVIEEIYALNIHGEPRWYKAIARPLWVDEEQEELNGIIGKIQDIHEEHMKMQALKKRAEQDSLTKLNNHMSAREQIEKQLRRNISGKYAMVLMDLDLFKHVNDKYGHMCGDAVLKDVARRITDNIRKKDIAARIGGDEFLIFISYKDEVEPIVRRVFESTSGAYGKFDISVSMGVAVCPKDGKNYDSLFQKADQALYAAKKRGRQQCCYYDDSVQGTLSVLSPVESEQENLEGL